jgi:excisionase family DNA binding protein
MARAKPDKPTIPQPAAPTPVTLDAEVLTLAEAAAYLRVSEDDVARLVREQGLPGRIAVNEWRFLKTAIQEWLRTPMPKPSREAVLSTVGAWKDDPTVDDLVKDIYRKRREDPVGGEE